MTRALVTGAGIRLGRAMALYLAGRGYDVAVHYAASHVGALETVAQIKAMGRSAVALQADLLDEDATQALFPAAVQALGVPELKEEESTNYSLGVVADLGGWNVAVDWRGAVALR